MGFPGWLTDKQSACNAEDTAGALGLIPGSQRSPGRGHSHPPQYSCLENAMDKGTWQATVHGGLKESDTTEQLTHSVALHLRSHLCQVATALGQRTT